MQFITSRAGRWTTSTGLSNGTVWALIALGYTLVYGIVELINFAHGEVFMIGAFVSRVALATFGVTESTALMSLIVALILVLRLAMLASGTLNVLIERVAYRPLRNAPKLAPLITAIGMSFILQNVGLLWRPTPDSVPDLIGSQHSTSTSSASRSALRHLRRRRDGPAADRPALVRRHHRLRQGDARHRAGPGRRAPDGHRRRPHDLADVPARRPAGRRGRA